MNSILNLIGSRPEDYNEVCCIGRFDKANLFLDDKDIIVGYLWYDYLLKEDKIMYIDYIMAKDINQGYGRKMIYYLFNHFDITEIQGETSDENRGFWVKIGAEVSNELIEADREMYDFSLKKQDFLNKNKTGI